jgi:phosphoribosylformylglycinamidine synthase
MVTNISVQLGQIPRVDLKLAPKIHHAMHQAILKKTVRACHDLSEGGLGVAAAEMAFAGGLGAQIELSKMPVPRMLAPNVLLFSESAPRYLVEVPRELRQEFEAIFAGLPHACIGTVIEQPVLQCLGPEQEMWIDEPIEGLRNAWQSAF